MIPEAAVEAAARAMYADARWTEMWDETHDERRAQYVTYARTALEAAAPHMADKAAETRLFAIAWTEAYGAGFQEGAGFGRTNNPYRPTP